MNCDDHRALLTHHAYGELGPSERGPLLLHLARCPACALEYCGLLADLDGIAASLEDPPAALGRRVRAAVERELRPRGLRRLTSALRRPVPAYALAAVLLLPLVLWARHGVEGRSGEPSSRDASGGARDGEPDRSTRHRDDRGALARPGTGSAVHPDQNRYDAAGPLLAARPIL